MKIKSVKLDSETLAVLLKSRIEGCNLFLPGQLPRPDYMRVAKAIEAAGGKWNRKAGCHVFPHDVRETLDIGADTVSVVDVQQTFQSFYTPPGVAGQMCEWADLMAGQTLLEPSAGMGALVQQATMHGIFRSDITAVEIDERRTEIVNMCRKVHYGDFMACNGELGKFDRVMMNPPFTGGQDVKHIKHALNFLDEGGRLVAICANGPKQREALEPLCDHWFDLEPGAFKESGTNVNAAIVVINGGAK